MTYDFKFYCFDVGILGNKEFEICLVLTLCSMDKDQRTLLKMSKQKKQIIYNLAAFVKSLLILEADS